ncbi:MAG: MoaD/ThiS family protein [Rhodospirillales bacterium]
MKIAVKMISIQGPAPPEFDADGNGVVEAAPDATLADVLSAMGLPENEAYVTLVNDDPVPAKDRAGRRLDPADRLTIFPPIKGG